MKNIKNYGKNRLKNEENIGFFDSNSCFFSRM